MEDKDLVIRLQRRLSEEHIARLKAEADQAHTSYWYAVRNAQLDDWARNSIPEELSNQYFSIAANGSLPDRPPTYAQQFNIMKYRMEKAEAELDKLKQESIDG